MEVGDEVIWRSGKHMKPNFLPLGIAGCIILELGFLVDEKDGAKIKLPPGIAERIGVSEAIVYRADLEG